MQVHPRFEAASDCVYLHDRESGLDVKYGIEDAGRTSSVLDRSKAGYMTPGSKYCRSPELGTLSQRTDNNGDAAGWIRVRFCLFGGGI